MTKEEFRSGGAKPHHRLHAATVSLLNHEPVPLQHINLCLDRPDTFDMPGINLIPLQRNRELNQCLLCNHHQIPSCRSKRKWEMCQCAWSQTGPILISDKIPTPYFTMSKKEEQNFLDLSQFEVLINQIINQTAMKTKLAWWQVCLQWLWATYFWMVL